MSKIAFFFVLDKQNLPENFGIKMSLEAIAPLYDTLLRDSSLTKLSYPECTAYCLRLFRKPFHTDVLIVMKDFDYHMGTDIETACVNEARRILDIPNNQGFYHPSTLQRALWLPKGLTRQEFRNLVQHFGKNTEVDPDELTRQDTAGGWLMSHPDGFIFGSKNEGDFLRAMVLNSLGMAYQIQTTRAINQLSVAATTGGSQLPKMVTDLNRFRSQYSFINPVNAGRWAEHTEYRVLSEHLSIPQLSTELDAKINQIFSYMQARQLDTDAVDQIDSFSAEPRSNAQQTSAPSSELKPAFGRTLFALLLLAVLGSAAYLLGTDAGRTQLDAWLGNPADNFLSEPSDQ